MFERRLQILLAVVGLVCCVLVVRAFSLQAVERHDWAEAAKKAVSSQPEVPTTRGRILDVKGRELAVDQPCIDACVHYEAVAFNRSLRSLRDASAERLVKKDPDFAKLDAAEQRRRLESDISKLIGEGSPATLKWLRTQARARVRRQTENYDQLPLAERWKLLNAAVCDTVADMETMWHDLAMAARQPGEKADARKLDDEMDELRRQIVRRVETRRRLIWYSRYKVATTEASDTASPWYATLLGGGGPVDLDKYDVHVSEEREQHVILPNIAYGLRNELARRIDHYPGLQLREGVIRKYPYGSVACQTIGRIAKVTPDDLAADPHKDDALVKYAASSDIGREGLEKLFEPMLRGTRGLGAAASDDPDDATPAADEKPPVPGQDVRTTIDIELQAAVEQAFHKVLFVRSAKLDTDELDMPGAAVLIDLPTGEIRAMASWPTYDLNQFDQLYPSLIKGENQIRRPLANRATTTALEPGSTVKPIVGISAITAGLFGANDTIHCNGYVTVNGREWHDWGRCWTMKMNKGTHQTLAHPHPTGDLTFPDALERSCNVFHEELAWKLGIDGLSHWFGVFGLGKPVGVGLPEASGILPDSWHGPAWQRMTTTCLAGIGQGQISATPLQMANVAATIARDGIAIRPTLSKEDRQPRVDLHLSPAAVAEARKGMWAVVNADAGTGKPAYMDDVVVAAKTGSAQPAPLRIPLRDEDTNELIRDDKRRVQYDELTLGTHANPNPRAPWYRATGAEEDTRPAHGWMIGFAPADHPKVAFAVLVEYGGGGGPAAGSVVKKMLEACIEQGYLKAEQ